MFKNLLIAAAIVSISPAFVFADDIFAVFGEGAAATNTSTATTADGSGSVSIYSNADFAFDALDLVISVSDPNVIQLTSRETFNPEFTIIGDLRFDSAEFPVGDSLSFPDGFQTTTDARLLLVNVTQNGVNPLLSSFDPGFDAAVGTDGAVLLAQLDYDILGAGTADLEFAFGPNGAIELIPGGENVITETLTFGPTASLTVETAAAIPEPSSVALLILGSIGLVARRKRA